MRRIITALLLTFVAVSAMPADVQACPMCKVANEKDAPTTGENGQVIDPEARPRAYMYSILFMLAMPATLLSGFGVAFYRMVRRESQMTEASEANESGADVL